MTGEPPTSINEDDYAAIEGAVMETSRGRWFLAEYARRNRNADTTAVLDAVARLGNVVGGHAPVDIERILLDISDMATAIAVAKAEIAALKPEGGGGRLDDATHELDAIVKSTETATEEILAAAEHLQEVAWTLREIGVDSAACDTIDQRATDIYTACSFQDITGQRTQKVIQVLRYLEARLDAMLGIWRREGQPAPSSRVTDVEAGLLNGPALPGRGLEQTDVDAMLSAAVAPPAPVDLPLPLALPVPASPFSPVEKPKPRAMPSAPPAPVPAASELEPAAAGAVVATPPERSISSGDRDEDPVRPPRRPRGPEPAVTLAAIEALSYDEKAALFS